MFGTSTFGMVGTARSSTLGTSTVGTAGRLTLTPGVAGAITTRPTVVPTRAATIALRWARCFWAGVTFPLRSVPVHLVGVVVPVTVGVDTLSDEADGDTDATALQPRDEGGVTAGVGLRFGL